MISFTEYNHKYKSIVPDSIIWTSVTSLVSKFKEPFPREEKALSCSRKKASKWYGISPQEILEAWDSEAKRSTDLGSWYHQKREGELKGKEGVIWYTIDGDRKLAPDQRLKDGIYPEHLIYLQSAGLCGQSDLVEVRDGKINISDYKTSKEITRKSFVNWEGVSKKMLKPIAHLEDSHINHYALQLSLYMYMILRYNPHLEPGKMIIEHVKFEQEAEDKWGYPLYRKDPNGDFTVQDIEYIEVPYMRSECIALIEYIKTKKQ